MGTQGVSGLTRGSTRLASLASYPQHVSWKGRIVPDDFEQLETAAGYLDSAAELIWAISDTVIDPADAASVAASALRVRVSRLLRACALLVRAGYAVETAGLVRSIWEDALSAAFIAESAADRAQQWIEFSEGRRGFHLQETISNPERVTTPEMLPAIEDALGHVDVASGNYWSGKGPTAVAKSLLESEDQNRSILGRDFMTYYATLCDDTHGSPFAVGQLLRPGDGAAAVTVGPALDRAGELVPLAVYGAFQFGHSVAVFGPELDTEALRSLLDEVHARLVSAVNPMANNGIERKVQALE